MLISYYYLMISRGASNQLIYPYKFYCALQREHLITSPQQSTEPGIYQLDWISQGMEHLTKEYP